MTLSSSLALALAIFILAASPGPGVFATVSRALASGFRSSLAVIAGIVSGDIIYLMLAMLGLSALAGTLEGLFFAVRLIGGGYLIWLGVHLWLTAGRGLRREETGAGQTNAVGRYLSGLTITLSNPKAILFYCGFLPSFLDFRNIDPAGMALAAGIVALVLGAVMTLYSLAARTAASLLGGGSGSAWLSRIAGSGMAAVGVIVAAGD